MEDYENIITEIYDALQSIYRAKEDREIHDFNQAIIKLKNYSDDLKPIDSFDEVE